MLSVIEGELPCRSVTLALAKGRGGVSKAKLGPELVKHQLRHVGNETTFLFENEMTLRKGDQLSLLRSAAS